MKHFPCQSMFFTMIFDHSLLITRDPFLLDILFWFSVMGKYFNKDSWQFSGLITRSSVVASKDMHSFQGLVEERAAFRLCFQNLKRVLLICKLCSSTLQMAEILSPVAPGRGSSLRQQASTLNNVKGFILNVVLASKVSEPHGARDTRKHLASGMIRGSNVFLYNTTKINWTAII